VDNYPSGIIKAKRSKEMSVKTISVNEKGMVFLNCPFCENSSRRRAESFPNSNQPNGISITCSSCGKTYEIQLDFRKAFRKITFFDGFYSKLGSPGGFEKMTVIDLSLGGCSFLASGRHSLNPDDRIKLVFNLDNAQHTKIEKDVVVRIVKGRQIGCEFIATASGYDPDIGFYLRPT
jgi:transcription elongation factor Elf1